jgi:eukaryotic-like serine/threonine-protein kinase
MRICPQCGTRFNEPIQFCPNDGSQTYEAQENQAPRQDPLLGRVIDGRYRIEQQIGEGGMGVVYMATHTVLQKKLALKVLRGDNSRDADVVQRFMQEAQAATSIGHSNIIDISDFGRLSDGSVYFVMEYLAGTSLAEMIKKGGSVPVQEAVHLIRQIASALEAAHARGIVHRDLKPDNIFVIRQGGDPRFVKVLDFGVAKVGGAASKLTKTGMVFGTPHYMSPEQAAGHSVDQRTDIYALGVIMYEMFTGKVPFDADTFMGILSKHMFEQPARPTDIVGASLGALETVVLRTLEKNPDHRYQSMADLLVDLDTVASGGSVQFGGRPGVPPPANLADALEPRTHAEVAIAQAERKQSGGGGKGIALVLLAIVALLFIGGGVGIGVFLYTGNDDGQALAQEPGDRATDDATHTVTANPPAIPPVVPPPVQNTNVQQNANVQPAQNTNVQVAPEQPRIAISSDPSGAEVLLDGVMVGNTPVELPRPESGTQTITLRMRGFEETTRTISPQSAQALSVTMDPERQASRAQPRQIQPTPVIQQPISQPVVRPQPQPRTVRSTSEVVDPWANK